MKPYISLLCILGLLGFLTGTLIPWLISNNELPLGVDMMMLLIILIAWIIIFDMYVIPTIRRILNNALNKR